MINIYLESLGCSKNQVDSEKMLYLLKNNGYNITEDPSIADIIIINTCAFIKSAKEEAIQTILELSLYKKEGRCRKIIVAGCLSQYYSKSIKLEIPEVDIVFGIGDITQIINVINNNDKIILNDFKEDDLTKRELLGFPGSAYIRISDGCNNNCSYCLIPKIRGGLRSRKIDIILEEIDFLKKKNINEFIIIAQDTPNYGIDIYQKRLLGDLISEIDKIIDINSWLRVLYMHPDHVDKDLIIKLKNTKSFIPYFDLPFQSGSDKILKLMNRHNNVKYYLDLIKLIRDNFNESIIRSTFITGFPQETEDDFNDTLKFIESAEIEWVGGFTYSKENDTKAGKMKSQIKSNIKKQRLDKILELSSLISSDLLKRFIGNTEKVLIEEQIGDDNLFIGRFWGQAPDVDGLTIIQTEPVKTGTFINAKITKLNDKDFFAIRN